ncbi:hypothetical protein CGC20_31635 [Leishmania donovani]|uniref:RNase III domain-containing protein n=1 Tax=Leishmania donovani TaxID=5661 RepID=A0A504XH94_LEIDO|nr:hypothetical protein CGC20_31635 [Leishmania donovani]
MSTSLLHLSSTQALHSSATHRLAATRASTATLLCSPHAVNHLPTTCAIPSRPVVHSSQAANVSDHHAQLTSGSRDWGSGGGTLFHPTRALRALTPVTVAHSDTFGSFRNANRAAAGTWWRSSTETASRVKGRRLGRVKDPFQGVFLQMQGCTEVEMTRRSPTPPPDFPLDSLPIYEPHDHNGPPRTKIGFHLPMRSLPASLALDFFFPGAGPNDSPQAANASSSSSRAHSNGGSANIDLDVRYEEAGNGAGSEHQQHTSRLDRAAHGTEGLSAAGAGSVTGDTSTAFCRLCRESFDNDGTLRSHITVADRARHVSHPVREVALETLTLLAVRGYPIDNIMTVWADILFNCPLFPRIRSMTDPRWSIEKRAARIGTILRALKQVGVLDVALATAEPTDVVGSLNSRYRRRRVAFERLEYIGDNCWGNNISNRILLLYPDQQWLYSERCSTFTLVRDACEMNVNLDFVFDTLELWHLLSTTAHSRLGSGKVKADLVEGIFGELHLHLYGMVPKLQDDVEYVETNGAREVQLVAVVEHCLTELYDLIVLKHARDLVTSAIPLAKELAAKRIWARTRPFVLPQKRPNTGRARSKTAMSNGAPHASAFPSAAPTVGRAATTARTGSFPATRTGAATANASVTTLEDLFDVSPSSLQQQQHDMSACGAASGTIESRADGRTEVAVVSDSGKGSRHHTKERAEEAAAVARGRAGVMPISPLFSTPLSLTLSASIGLGSTRVLPALPRLFTTPHVYPERVPNPLRLLPLSAIPSMTYCHHTRSDVFARMKVSYERLGLLHEGSSRMHYVVSPIPPAWAVLIGTLVPQLVGFVPLPVKPIGDIKGASAEARRLLVAMDEGGLYCRDALYNLAVSPSSPAAASSPHAAPSPMSTAWTLQNAGLPSLSVTPSKTREDDDDASSGKNGRSGCTFAPSRYVPPGIRAPPAGVVTDRVRSSGEGPAQHSAEDNSPKASATVCAQRMKAATDYWRRRSQTSLQNFSAGSGTPMPPSGKVGSSAAQQVVDMDPLLVYFTFSRIRPRFSCGRTIESTLKQFRDGELHPRDLPLLSVLTDGAHYYSQNNRRLYVYKQLKREGLLDMLPVRLRPLPQTKRMRSKYSPQTCALNATLMRDTANRDGLRDASATAADSSDASDIEGSHDDHDACTSLAAVGEPGAGDDEFRRGNRSAPSSSSPPRPASCATGSGLEREAVGSGDTRKAPTRRNQKKQPQPQHGLALSQQSSNANCSETASQRPGKSKGAAAARSPSTSSSDGGGNGGTSALEAELRKLGLHT